MSKKKLTPREKRFDEAMDQLIRTVDRWHDLLNDPFKAPEQKLGLPRDVSAAAWELGIAWHILTEEPKA